MLFCLFLYFIFAIFAQFTKHTFTNRNFMSKFFHFILMVATLVATSCMGDGLRSSVTFVADLGGIETRAIADGTTVNQVAWAVYVDGSNTPLEDMWGTMPLTNRQAVLNLRLATGRTYDIVFFAYYTENPSSVAEVNGEINPLFYNVSLNERSVSVKYDNATANDERRDCFWHAENNLKVEGSINKTFLLTRPLAQLNFGVTESDFNSTLGSDFQIADTEITVDSYTKFNLFDGSLSELVPTTVKFERNTTPLYNDDYLIIKEQSERYKYLATTYTLVNQKCTSNVTLTFWDNKGIEVHTLNYSFVPLQRNYRTNIIGHLLTNPHLFTIVIDEKFEADHTH